MYVKLAQVLYDIKRQKKADISKLYGVFAILSTEELKYTDKI